MAQSKKRVKKSLTKSRKSPTSRKSPRKGMKSQVKKSVKKSVKNMKKTPVKKSVKRSRVRKHKYGLQYIRDAAKAVHKSVRGWCGGRDQPSFKDETLGIQSETPSLGRRRFIPGVTTPRNDEEKEKTRVYSENARRYAREHPYVATREDIEILYGDRARRVFLKRILDIYNNKLIYGDFKKKYIADKEYFEKNPRFDFKSETGLISIEFHGTVYDFDFYDINIKSFFREYNKNIKGMSIADFEKYDKNYRIENDSLVYRDPVTEEETWFRPMHMHSEPVYDEELYDDY